MQYYLCPRCQFRVPAKKNACTTCGYDMLPLKTAAAQQNENKSVKTSIWSRMLGDKKEQGKEKPALS
jgi:ribosomal protein L40E